MEYPGIIHYTVRMPAPETHFFEVEMHIAQCPPQVLPLHMAVWTPGSYLVREYAKNVDSVQASCNGKPVLIQKLRKNIWELMCPGGDLVIRYRVYAFEESVRTCYLDAHHASIIPAGLFIYPPAHTGSFHITCVPHPSWNVISTALPEVQGNTWVRAAKDLDTLIDSPIEIGTHQTYFFVAEGIQHEYAIYGEGNQDIHKIIQDTTRIVEEETRIFQQHPCSGERYVFIVHNSKNMRGGLEHKFSTSLIYKRLQYHSEAGYREFISLVAHEYFHLWNVKRLRPAALGPFDYDNENYTSSLWIAEGFTSYYDDLIVKRCDLMSEQAYLDILAKNIAHTLNAPGDAVQAIGESSFDAWIKYYRQNENTYNAQVNYYTKGSVLALMLDLMIIIHSGGKYSLDNVMRETYRLFYLEADAGYTEDQFREILEKYCGTELRSFYADHVFGTVKIQPEKWLEKIGIHMEVTRATDDLAVSGYTLQNGNTISFIRANSAAAMAGLQVGDEILAINDHRFDENLLGILLQANGGPLHYIVDRKGMIERCILTPGNTDKMDVALHISDAENPLLSVWWNSRNTN